MAKKKMSLPHHHHDTGTEEKVLNCIPEQKDFVAAGHVLKQVGDPSRLKIFWLLCHAEECVINIAAIMEMSSPAVAHHLKRLKDAGLIISRRDGKEMYYRAADTESAHALHRSVETILNITCPKYDRSYLD